SVARGTVRIHGAAADAFSGIDRIELEIADALEREPTVVVSATCDGCGAYHGCFHAGPCGWRSDWEFEGAVPVGIRDVTAVVRDLAGNEMRAEPFTVVVLA
ncbi:MAG TPA: hypothetical protein VM600_04435, partial [Actinomycetota bacterium]|nr:hypothetical protein [Actinomycetota bacterium]